MPFDSKGYYAILGVSERATYHEIRRSYRKLARKYHPDRNSSTSAEDMIKRINAAFEVLSDHRKRAEYDSSGIVTTGEQEFGKDERSEHVEGAEKQDASYARHDSDWQPEHRIPARGKAKDRLAAQETYSGPSFLDTPKGRFHIIVEPSLCMAFGSCETLAPKVFVVEKNKRVNPKARVECETCADLDKIYAAAQTCPTKAIRIVDRYTGELIFP